jgi:hypothetical protein
MSQHQLHRTGSDTNRMVTRFATSPPTDNCPQPKEAQPLSQLDIRLIQHFDSSALWSDGPEVALNWPFPYPI